MEEKTIINYASGGLGNILLPLSSCIALAKEVNRKPVICWEPTFRCMATFKDIFDNDIDVIEKKDLLSYENVKIYGDFFDINFDGDLYFNHSLVQLGLKNTILPVSLLKKDDIEENVVVYHNNIIPAVGLEPSVSALKSLKIKDEILEQVEEFSSNYFQDAEIFGAHARGTDFNNPIDYYLNGIRDLINNNNDCKIFLCSDSPEWEKQILDLYPNNIILREKKHFVTKLSERNTGWSNNALTSKEAVIEGLIDMLLLSKTNFSVFNNQSSFAQVVNHLRKV